MIHEENDIIEMPEELASVKKHTCLHDNENRASKSLRDSVVMTMGVTSTDIASPQKFNMYPIGGYYALVLVWAEA